MGKNPSVGDWSLIPESGRLHGGGSGDPLSIFAETSWTEETWWATVHRSQSSTQLQD